MITFLRSIHLTGSENTLKSTVVVSGYLRVRCGTEAFAPRYYKVSVCEYISGGKRAPRRPDPDDDYSGVRNPAPVVASANADGTSSCPGCGRKDKK